MRLPADATLIVFDMGEAIGDPRREPPDNADAEAKIAALIAAWRAEGLPLIHVRHDSIGPESPGARDAPGHRFKASPTPREVETVIGRAAHGAFVGTRLEALLEDIGATTLVLCGALAANALEPTVRDAANLGFSVFVVADACCAADTIDPSGTRRPAENARALSLARLEGEDARIVDAATALNAAATAKARQRRAAGKA